MIVRFGSELLIAYLKAEQNAENTNKYLSYIQKTTHDCKNLEVNFLIAYLKAEQITENIIFLDKASFHYPIFGNCGKSCFTLLLV